MKVEIDWQALINLMNDWRDTVSCMDCPYGPHGSKICEDSCRLTIESLLKINLKP